MRKIALLLVLLLWAFPASAAEYTAEDLFTVTYDEDFFQLDDFTFLDDCTDSREWLFMLYSTDAVVDVSRLKLDFSIENDRQRQAYLADMLDSYADDQIVHVLTLDCGSQHIPFEVFQLEDEEGPYLLAEAVIDGWGYDFSAYYEDSRRTLDSDLNSRLVQLLRTFEPVK